MFEFAADEVLEGGDVVFVAAEPGGEPGGEPGADGGAGLLFLLLGWGWSWRCWGVAVLREYYWGICGRCCRSCSSVCTLYFCFADGVRESAGVDPVYEDVQSREGDVFDYVGLFFSVAAIIDDCEEVSRSVADEVTRDGKRVDDGVFVLEKNQFRVVFFGIFA